MASHGLGFYRLRRALMTSPDPAAVLHSQPPGAQVEMLVSLHARQWLGLVGAVAACLLLGGLTIGTSLWLHRGGAIGTPFLWIGGLALIAAWRIPVDLRDWRRMDDLLSRLRSVRRLSVDVRFREVGATAQHAPHPPRLRT